MSDSLQARQELFVKVLALRVLDGALNKDDFDAADEAQSLIALMAIEELGHDPSDEALEAYVQGVRRTLKALQAQMLDAMTKADSS